MIMPLTTLDLIEFRLLRDRLRTEAERLESALKSPYWIATDQTRQAERWLAVVEKVLAEASHVTT